MNAAVASLIPIKSGFVFAALSYQIVMSLMRMVCWEFGNTRATLAVSALVWVMIADSVWLSLVAWATPVKASPARIAIRMRNFFSRHHLPRAPWT